MSKVRISLPKADRERLNAPEVLEVDIEDIDIEELCEIEDVLGLTLVTFVQGWPRGPRTMKAAAWLGLRRAGIRIPLADFSFKAYGDGASYNQVRDDVSPGKAEPEADSPPTPPSGSATSAPSTKSRSRSSSSSSRGKSGG